MGSACETGARAASAHRCRSLLPPPPFLLSLLECHLHVTIEELVKRDQAQLALNQVVFLLSFQEKN